MQEKQNKKSNKEKSKLTDYSKYSSIAFQMMVIIFMGVFGGMKLDKYLNWKFPVFTVVFSILSVFLAIYFSVKDFIKFK